LLIQTFHTFYISVPTSEDAGRSDALTLLVMDETAFMRYAEGIWASAMPTLSCVIPSTPILVKKDGKVINTTLGFFAPDKLGQQEIKGYEAFTHKGVWKKITHGVNKGELETWYVQDDKGETLGGTPKHRLLTPQGWKTIEEIIEKDLYVIQRNVTRRLAKVRPNREELAREPERWVTIKGFPKFQISSWGNIVNQRTGNIRKARENKDGYLRVPLTRDGVYRTDQKKLKTFMKSVSGLVFSHFIGDIQEGLQVDHKDDNRKNNYYRNLQLLSGSENVSKAYGNLQNTFTSFQGSRNGDLLRKGLILALRKEGHTKAEISNRLRLLGYNVTEKRVEGILYKNKRKPTLYISKLRVVKKTRELIVDIQVEGDHSYITSNNYINHNTGGSAILNSTAFGIGNFGQNHYLGVTNLTLLR